MASLPPVTSASVCCLTEVTARLVYHLGLILGAPGIFFADRFAIIFQLFQFCGHCGYLGCGHFGLCESGFCQRADSIKNLPGIEAALAGKPPPVPPLEVIAPALT